MNGRPLLTTLFLMGFGFIAYTQNVDISNIRTISGEYNNLVNPEWGSAGENLLRLSTVGYEDGISTPAGPDRPNPRTISNVFFSQEGLINDPLALSDFCWVFGQFIDHDIGLTPEGTEDATIFVPAGDPYFDPFGVGQAVIPMHRNIYDHTSGTGVDNPRQHPNIITAFIDGSAIYGSSEERMNWLRSFEGGKLRVSTGNFLPYNTETGEITGSIDENHPAMDNPVGKTNKIFVAGDARANENPLLTSFHTLFMREHNRLCDELAKKHPDWGDEELFQYARKMVGGYIQSIVFKEWLPAMGLDLPPYAGYNANVNPQLLNVFSGSAFRLGHTLLNSNIRRMNDEGRVVPGGNISLKDAFFDPTWIAETGSIDPFFKGMATQTQQMLDPKVIDEVRNFLFGPPGAGGLDLASININRGRERGLPDFNTLRQDFGLPAYTSFNQITSRQELGISLSDLYGDINNIDSWVGLLAEEPMPDALFGETIMRIMTYQFASLRDGDRFYYENDPLLTDEEKAGIKKTTLQDLIMRNTGIKLMQGNVFKSMPHTEICDNLMVDVFGKISMENGQTVGNVLLTLQNSDAEMEILTDSEGAFSFPPARGCDVNGLQVFKDDDVHNGVTTVDLILVTKHILGARLLDTPYKFIAADVNHSNSISVLDLVRLRKVILSIYDSFPNNTAWRFIPKDFEFTDPANPLLDAIPDNMVFELLGSNLNQEFIAVKIGDINSSVKLDGEQRAVIMEETPMVLQIEDRMVTPGEFVEVVITSPHLNKVEGFQFTLDYDETALYFEGLDKGVLPNQSTGENFGVFDFDGAITTSWNKPEGEQAFMDGKQSVIFKTRFLATRAGRLRDFINVNSDFTVAEAYDNQLNTQQLALNFTEVVEDTDDFELFQNRPNPVRFETTIPFVLPEGGDANLYITDLSGRVIYTASAAFNAGENNWRLGREVLHGAGTYFYTLETSFGRATKKFLVVE